MYYRLAFDIGPDPILLHKVDEARDYLFDADMTMILKEDKRIDKDTLDKIQSIWWTLVDNTHGNIFMRTTTALRDDELKAIRNWCDGQNSDGLGAGFSEQDFAQYTIYTQIMGEVSANNAENYSCCNLHIRDNEFVEY